MSGKCRALLVASPTLIAVLLVVLVVSQGASSEGNWAALGVVVYAPIWLPLLIGLTVAALLLTARKQHPDGQNHAVDFDPPDW